MGRLRYQPLKWDLLLTIIVMVCVWQCYALVSHPPTMKKQPTEPEQLFQVTQMQDETEKQFALECEAEGNPEPTYRWIKNGENFDYVPYDTRISQQPKRGTLVFTKLEDVDEGLYQCFAENVHGTSVSNAVLLRKAELSSFPDEKPKRVRVVEGTPLTLDCNPPTGYPKPSIFWIIQSYNGALLSLNSARITVDPEGDLHFAHIKIDDALDEAMYVCSATSFFRNEYKLGNRVILKVEASGISGRSSHPPVVQYVSPPNITVLRGNKLKLICIFGGNPLPDIVWRKNGEVLQGDRFTYDNYGKTLKIRRIDYQDEGTYECTASNGQGQPQTHEMSVTVHEIPFWIKTPNNTNASEEESVRFECLADGTPEPKLRWFVNGVPIEGAPLNSRRKFHGNVLIIENLKKTDTAAYQCNASNAHGYAFRDFYLNVLAKTRITQPPENVEVAAQKSATFRCNAVADPGLDLEVEWLFNGKPIDFDHDPRMVQASDNSLTITKTVELDAGIYTCIAKTEMDKDVAEATLTMQAVPNPPNIVNVECENFTALVEWQSMGENHAPILVYTLQYNTSFTPDIWEDAFATIPAEDPRFNVHMSPWANYTFRVIARNEFGPSIPSEVSKSCTSAEDVPYMNPSNVTGMGREPTYLVISWTVMPPIDHNAPGFFYKVYWKRDDLDEKWQSVKIDDWKTDHYVIDGGGRLKQYRIKVEAHNKLGKANETAAETIGYSGEYDVPNPPKIVDVQCDRFTAVVEWQPMGDCHSPILDYTLQYNTSFSPDIWQDAVATIPAQDTRFKFDMSPWAKYTFQVIARNKIGPSLPSEVSKRCKSPEDVPYKNPDKVNGRGTTRTNLVISWTVMPPIDHNAPGFFYKVYWTRDDLDEIWHSIKIGDWQTNHYVIDGQETFKPYRIKVEAHNMRGQANVTATETLGYSGIYDVPYPPKIVDIECDRFFALVEWQPRDENSAPVMVYTLQYNTSFTPDIWKDACATIPGSDTRFKVLMSPWANYTFRVIAKNKFGSSVPSRLSKMCTTAEDVPYSNPDKVNGMGTTPTNLVISWKVMPPIDHNAPGFFYKVYWKRDDLDERWQAVKIDDWQTNHCVIDGLDIFKPYRIKVEAHNKRGQANVAATEVIGYSGVYADVPNPPQFVDIQCDRFIALVQWQPMGDCHPPILGYTLQYNTSFTPDIWEDAVATIPAPETRFKVLMSPWANYTFRVIARNKIGPSLPSGVSKTCTSSEDVPYKNPDKVRGRGTGGSNLVISWMVMPPIDHNAPGFFYKVYWKQDDLDESWQSVKIDNWKTNHYVIGGLDTFKQYRIKVEAHNKRGKANVTANSIVGYSGVYGRHKQ